VSMLSPPEGSGESGRIAVEQLNRRVDRCVVGFPIDDRESFVGEFSDDVVDSDRHRGIDSW
jgi:hypothetical protein